jgi:hypothetical protein
VYYAKKLNAVFIAKVIAKGPSMKNVEKRLKKKTSQTLMIYQLN